MKKILVPLDGSKVAERVLPYAGLLAEACKASVELLGVEDAGVRSPFSSSGGARDYLHKVATSYFPQAVRVEEVVERGKAAGVIIERAKRDPDCLIAMVTHGLSGIKRWLLGSVAVKVVQGAENSLLLVRAADGVEATDQVKFESIIVSLDGSQLAEQVLPSVVDLGKAMNVEVVLVRAFELPATAYYRADEISPTAAAFIPSYKELVAEFSREPREYLEGKMKELRGRGLQKVRAEVLEGAPAEIIIDLARKTRGSLIAMCTHGLSGIKRWVLGSVAEKVVNHAENPVLIIRAC